MLKFCGFLESRSNLKTVDNFFKYIASCTPFIDPVDHENIVQNKIIQ